MAVVYIVLQGEDCEGAEIQAVFSKKQDAIKYLDTEYKNWKTISPEERRSGCTTAFVEKWDIQ